MDHNLSVSYEYEGGEEEEERKEDDTEQKQKSQAGARAGEEDEISDESIASSLPGSPPSPHDIFKPSSNVKFNPLPSVSGKCAKLKINLLFNSSLFVGGEAIQGSLEVISQATNKTTHLYLGEIGIQIAGFEEISYKGFHQSSKFLTQQRLYQGDRLPPSDAVHGAPTKDGYYLATKGKTVFHFSFQLPTNTPSSFEFGSISKLLYNVTGSVQFKYGNQIDTIFKTCSVQVAERWNLKEEKRHLFDAVTASNYKKLFMGGNGKVHMTASLKQPFCTAGSSLGITIQLTNDSKKRVQGLKVLIVKRLIISCHASSSQDDDLKVIDEVVQTVNFKDKGCDALERNNCSLFVNIPVNAQTVRHTHISEIVWAIQVSLPIPGLLSKDLVVELPITVAHSKSIEALHPNLVVEVSQAPTLPHFIGQQLEEMYDKVPITTDDSLLPNSDRHQRPSFSASRDNIRSSFPHMHELVKPALPQHAQPPLPYISMPTDQIMDKTLPDTNFQPLKEDQFLLPDTLAPFKEATGINFFIEKAVEIWNLKSTNQEAENAQENEEEVQSLKNNQHHHQHAHLPHPPPSKLVGSFPTSFSSSRSPSSPQAFPKNQALPKTKIKREERKPLPQPEFLPSISSIQLLSKSVSAIFFDEDEQKTSTVRVAKKFVTDYDSQEDEEFWN